MSTPSRLMQSFILISKNIEQTEKEWQELCLRNGVEQIDQTILESERALGIEDIRIIQKTIFLTPIKGAMKGILVKNSHTLTIPAQNAFLKLLEEPPAHSIIVLQTPSQDLLLPTIVSRCVVLNFKPQSSEFAKLNLPESEKERFELAGEWGKTKEEALSFLEQCIIGERGKMLKNNEAKHARALKSLQKAHTIISTTNLNPQFVLENILLNV